MGKPVALKAMLAERHWQTYRVFCAQYDKAAASIDKKLVGSYPSRPQLHRWLNGDLKGLPYSDHCRVLEAMFPGVRATEMFAPAEEKPLGAGNGQPNLGELVAAGLNAPATELHGWRPAYLKPAGLGPSVAMPSGRNESTTDHLARAIALLGKRLRLTEAEVTELAKLAGHVIDLELDCSIDIDENGDSSVTYRFEVVNLTDRPVKRMIREQWFETTDGRLRIEPHPSSDRDVSIQRIHDTANMTKFACVISPAIAPGETATIAYVTRGGRFLHDHYWRQSTPRYTRHLTLTIRHRAVDMLVNCTAIEDHSDGSQDSAIDDLVCTHDDGDALITLTRDYLQPSDAVTVRWEVSRGAT